MTTIHLQSRISPVPAPVVLHRIASVVTNQRVGPCNSSETRHFFPTLCKNLSPPVKSLFSEIYAVAICRQSLWSSETRSFRAFQYFIALLLKTFLTIVTLFKSYLSINYCTLIKIIKQYNATYDLYRKINRLKKMTCMNLPN